MKLNDDVSAFGALRPGLLVDLPCRRSGERGGEPTVHAHTVVALSDGSTRGGHLTSARVSIIAEIFVTEEEGAVMNAKP